MNTLKQRLGAILLVSFGMSITLLASDDDQGINQANKIINSEHAILRFDHDSPEIGTTLQKLVQSIAHLRATNATLQAQLSQFREQHEHSSAEHQILKRNIVALQNQLQRNESQHAARMQFMLQHAHENRQLKQQLAALRTLRSSISQLIEESNNAQPSNSSQEKAQTTSTTRFLAQSTTRLSSSMPIAEHRALPRENPAIETNDSNEDESSAISLLASLSHSEPRKAVALSYDFSDDSSTDVDDEPLTTATHSAERSSSSQSEVWTISTHEAHCNICNKSFVSRSKSKRDRHEKSEGHKTNLRQQQTRGRKRPREAARKTQQFMTKAVSNNVMDAISSDFADDIPTDLGNVSTTTTTTRKQNVIDADEWNKIRDRIGIKIKQRKFDQAMQQAQQAIERANQNKQPKYTLLARYQIAVIQHKQGNLKGAIRDYQTVLSKARKDNPHITSYAEKRLREATKELSAKRQKTHNSTTSIADQVNPVSGEPLQ